MRNHLVKCLEEEDPKPFPMKHQEARYPKVLKSITVDVFCSCRLPNDGNTMVFCSLCKKWFHKQCTALKSKTDEEIKTLSWECVGCAC